MAQAETYDINALRVYPAPVLDACSERMVCQECGKKVKFFCYYCYRPVAPLEGKIPQIRLPFKLDVVKHEGEKDGKSTALHAKVMAPEDVTVIAYSPDCLDNVDVERTALLFPGPDATNIADMDPASYDKVIVIDGTWKQAKGMLHNNKKLRHMRKVTVNPRRTKFWRYQNFDDSYMATIEAIYFLYRDSVPAGYNGEYDALMYFFKYFYDFIQSEYVARPEKSFHGKHQKGYIAYDTVAPSTSLRQPKPGVVADANYDFDGALDLDLTFQAAIDN
ncbi:hypothetical protein GGI21_001381 [Coemansia aciculifera]|uniref:Uncharacterized protein n=1 Tax=Coemansia aciculifera TaxID=417176 RepID=A0ACC1M627_9FUNG|nr:hypothetical protein IWW38_001842 [Coemansia aciculifera]KAJ2909931.1 hypothetical protein GGI21_001381 [Coemansia aciculifera]